MELKKESIRHYEAVFSETVTVEQNAEMIVPDSYPDIAQIVDTSGIACLKDKVMYSDRLELSGLCKAGILYVPEGETGLRKLDINIPFLRALEGSMEGAPMAVATVRVLSADARMVNPRKVQVAVSLVIEAKVYAHRMLELTDEVYGEAEGMPCEVLKNTENAWLLTAIQDKAVTVTEELEIQASRPSMEEILKADVRLSSGEMKTIGAKAVFKGMAFVRLIYAAAGRPYLLEQEFPFSQIIELEGAEDSSMLEASLQLAGLDMDFMPGGEARKLGLTLYVDVTLLAYADKRMETVCDLYGIGTRLKPEMTPLTLHTVEERTVRRQNVRESIEVGEEIQEVVDASVLLGPVISHDGRTGCDCQIKITYCTESGHYAQTIRNAHVPCPSEEALPGEIRAELIGEVVAASMAGGVEARFAVDFQMTNVRERRLMSVTGIIEEAGEPEECAYGSCNVILRRCRSGESLWDIAKRYGSTRRELALCNKLEGIDHAPEGKVLLIPRYKAR